MQQRSLFPPFAGVALADILANSVAIVIIMIVVMLMTRYDEEQDKLEQTEDVAVLLSRELATSFVMNALPTSPPAQLHDYVVSPLDRNPQHATMPILELHDDFVRDYYTGRIYRRDELLRYDNALDAYLVSLAPEQLAAMRVDVYGIGQFYVAMSIFKAHHHQPRHWHFLGGSGGASSMSATNRLLAGREPTEADSAAAPGEGRAGGDLPRLDAGHGGALPADVALAHVGTGSEAYPNDAPAGTGGALAIAQEYFELPGGTQGDDAAANAGLGAGNRRRSREQEGDGSDRAGNSFRAAIQTEASVTLEDIQTLDMAVVLRGLFAYMAAEQEAADNGLPSGLPRYDFRRDVLARVATLPDPTPQEAQLLRSLVFLMEAPRRPDSTSLDLALAASADWRGQALAVFANEPLHSALWLRDIHQPATVAETGEVTLQLGAHAAIHEGLRVSLGREDVVLMPSVLANEGPRWRIVTLVSAARDDFVTGFLFAATDDAGRLILPTEENAVDVDGLRATAHFPAVAFRDEFRQLLFYGLLACFLVGGLVCRRWWRQRALAA